ncbi:ribosome biogenesis GTP-binding protein YihA/YsxC [Longimicrobium sp.]|uniref:ribosome biogenesis GTP-binding protein YihA/YsxC n=1 Tax=Longimicrobium sp. TaxID=2029185 RepID=UPI002E3460A3|nr:ribosome biogenesis GTP-binding protein YihA/YsxC [Longimicrobium sp.]HEX6036868.1 ribosome biogenesis GTP-binding protein YihA/YsxC [Longimicrobium sp.]
MRIKSVEFAGAIGQPGQPPPESARGMPQVAFSGRSNVGKSSLINRLLGRTRTAIARVSATPGKTQEINFYRVRSDLGDFFLVDLPGYGFARAPEEARKKWEKYISSYLSRGEDLAGVVQLIDLRTGPTPDDLRSVEYLAELGLPVLFAFTKSDKLTATKRKEAFDKTVKALGIEPDQAIAFSSLKGDGRDDLLETLGALVFPQGDESADEDGSDGDEADADPEGEVPGDGEGAGAPD